ncbi:hypothetical protein D9M68_563480 [compost metagenome]
MHDSAGLVQAQFDEAQRRLRPYLERAEGAVRRLTGILRGSSPMALSSSVEADSEPARIQIGPTDV